MSLTLRLEKFASSLIIVVMLLATYTHASAQWETVYGGASCREAAYKGVQPLLGSTCLGSGGAVAAGVSFSSSLNCSTADVYVVRFATLTGAIIWQNTYDINDALRNDSATSITQVSDGFIVVGNTDQGASNTDIFIMKINCDGSLAWVRTYGANNGEFSEDLANDVIIATSGNAANGTSVGDIVVCGSTTGTGGSTLGYLIRTTSAGALIWDATYNMPFPHMGETMSFKSLIQAVPIGAIGQVTGDIVAVGTTNMVGNAFEALAARVDGDNGGMLANPPSFHGMATYGSTRIDEFWTVIEHSTTPAAPARQARHLIFAGVTSFIDAAQRNAAEIYIVKATGDPTVAVVEVTVGDGVPGLVWEEAHSLIESGGTNGAVGATDLVLTGYWWNLNGGLAIHHDVLLLGLAVPLIQPTPPLPPVIPAIRIATRYGGQSQNHHDIGNAIAEVGPGVGWLIAGASSSNLKATLPPDPEDMYVLQPDDIFGTTGGCSQTWTPTVAIAAYGPVAHAPLIGALGLSANALADNYWPTWDDVAVCPRPIGKRVVPTAESAQRDLSMSAYPNPVRRGDVIQLAIGHAVIDRSRVSVLNDRGENVLEIETPFTGVKSTVAVPTESLESGFYSLRVGYGERSRYVPFVVVR